MLLVEVVPVTVTVRVVTQLVLEGDCVRAHHASFARKRKRRDLMIEVPRVASARKGLWLTLIKVKDVMLISHLEYNAYSDE